MKAIRIQKPGSPSALLYQDVALPEPGPAEVRVKIEVAGVNFIDTYHRSGQYQQNLPFTPGMEAGGVVDALGERVTAVSLGDRVAYAMHLGAYAEYAIVPAWRLVHVPDEIEMKVATAVSLQGMTAHYLTHSTYAVSEGDTVLVHAAAGGMGLLLVQMAKLRGARVIGTTSTADKAQLAREYGADHVILYTETDFSEAVLELSAGQGIPVIYDGVGQDTFRKGLDCLQPRGMMVLYGQASGPVGPFDPQILNQKGSLFLTRPSLAHYSRNHEEIEKRMNDLFNWIKSGSLRVQIDRAYPLGQAKAAHLYIESRQTKGKLLLLPQHLNEPPIPEGSIELDDPVDESGWESFPASDPPSY